MQNTWAYAVYLCGCAWPDGFEGIVTRRFLRSAKQIFGNYSADADDVFCGAVLVEFHSKVSSSVVQEQFAIPNLPAASLTQVSVFSGHDFAEWLAWEAHAEYRVCRLGPRWFGCVYPARLSRTPAVREYPEDGRYVQIF